MSEPKPPTLKTNTEPSQTAATLHMWGISPFCYKVRMAAACKGIEFDEQISDFGTMMTAKSETGSQKVPVIETPKGWVTDSTRIARWLEERHPEPSLYPSDPEQRIRCDLLEDWADEALNMAAEPWIWLGDGRLKRLNALCAAEQPTFGGRVFMKLIRPMQRRIWKGRTQKHGGLEATRNLLRSQLDLLERRLGDRSWMFGETPTIADFAIAGQLANLIRFDADEDLRERPRVHRLVSRAIELLPDADEFDG